MNTEQLRWALAGAKVACTCKGTPSRGGIGGHPFSASCTCCRDTCNGTGQAYVLPDRIRVICSLCAGSRVEYQPVQPYGSGQLDCHSCDGFGYKPAKDLETWMQAAWETHCRLNHLFSHTKLIHLAFAGYSGLDKFVEKLAELLQSRGIKLDSYKEEEQEAPKQHEVGP